MKQGKHVYDAKGNAYVYCGETCSSGFIVTPIYTGGTYWIDGHEEPLGDEFGEDIILNKIYDEPPTHKQAEQIKELNSKIEELKQEKKKLSREVVKLNRLLEQSPKEIIDEKFKDMPNFRTLINIVNKTFPVYSITSDNRVSNTDFNTIAINIDTGKLTLLEEYEWSVGTKFDFVNLYDAKFVTIEDAEKEALKRIADGGNMSDDYLTLAKMDSLWNKYNIKRPQRWIDQMENARKEHLKHKVKQETWISNNIDSELKQVEKIKSEIAVLLKDGETVDDFKEVVNV